MEFFIINTNQNFETEFLKSSTKVDRKYMVIFDGEKYSCFDADFSVKNQDSKEMIFWKKNKEDKSKCLMLCADFFINPQDVGDNGNVKLSEIKNFIK